MDRLHISFLPVEAGFLSCLFHIASNPRAFFSSFKCAIAFIMALNARHSIKMEADGGMAQLVIAVVFGVLATIAVTLRIISRRLSRVCLGMTDYMIILALVQALAPSRTK